MGSVSPLLAAAKKIEANNPQADFLFIGTRSGPEKKVIESQNITFKPIFSGKFRRYFSFRFFIDPFLVLIGLIQSIVIIRKFKPDLVVAAGSFVAVPLVWAAWLLRIPSVTHQQDIIPGLANLLMSRFVKMVTVTFSESLKDFPKDKARLTGNPYRQEILTGTKEKAIEDFKLLNNRPTVLVLGGGTGALEINKLLSESLPELLKFCQVIHATGQGRGLENNRQLENYHGYEFLNKELPDALAVADLIITRAGFSTLTELAVLGKPAVIIPMPESHQEDNAKYFAKNNAALVVNQKSLTPDGLAELVKDLLANPAKRAELSRNIQKMIPKESTDNFVKEILNLIQ